MALAAGKASERHLFSLCHLIDKASQTVPMDRADYADRDFLALLV